MPEVHIEHVGGFETDAFALLPNDFGKPRPYPVGSTPEPHLTCFNNLENVVLGTLVSDSRVWIDSRTALILAYGLFEFAQVGVIAERNDGPILLDAHNSDA
ncbi:MAG: hypothetical protein ACLQIB_46295 [Isosphaeraceae bacterium]